MQGGLKAVRWLYVLWCCIVCMGNGGCAVFNSARIGQIAAIKSSAERAMTPDVRDAGYNPFGALAFLSWDHSWNEFKYHSRADVESVVESMQDAGIGFVRMDFYWNDIEPSRGVFDFKKYDTIVEILVKHHIGILAILHYSADWAAPAWNNPPDDFDVFAGYCRQVVSRYKKCIRYWEVWNEPDSSTYWVPQDGMKAYVELLKRASTAIKAEDATARVVMGGLTNQGYFALKNMYRLGAAPYFDIVNIHPFTNPLGFDALGRVRSLHRQIRRLMAEYGDAHKRIWFTELGCPGTNNTGAHATWWEGTAPTEEQQACFVRQVYTELLFLENVDKIFWAYFRDNKDHFKDAVDYFGLVRWDGSRKPAFYEYKKISRAWSRVLKGDTP